MGVESKPQIQKDKESKEAVKIPDNYLIGYMFESVDRVIIKYPETPKPITPEIEDFLRAVRTYHASFGSHIDQLYQAKIQIWEQLKKIDPSLTEFSEDSFYKVFITKISHYLEPYAILCMQDFWYTKDPQSGNFTKTEIISHFLSVEKVENDEVNQWGEKISRRIVYVRGPLNLDRQSTAIENSIPNAANQNGNILIYEPGIKKEFEELLSGRLVSLISAIRQSGNKKEGIKNITQGDLERSNSSYDAIEVALVGVVERMEAPPTIEEFRAEILAHETRHLFDLSHGNYSKLRILKRTTNASEHDNYQNNRLANEEIYAVLGDLKYAPNKKLSLFRILANMRIEVGNKIHINNFYKWIVGHMVGIISQNPESYGIEISVGSVNTFNQILSQIDKLLDRPDLLSDLCDKIIALHNTNPQKDFVNATEEELYGSIHAPKDKLNSILKIGVPGVVAGGAMLAIEALRRRKKKVATEEAKLRNMTRSERRAHERKKNKK
ncbi:MAG: hypothetical protein WCT44_00245 [Candidatus Paceibacterota bacterium]